jgi:O-antigen/teichoic acid export membrane protein
MNGIAKRVPRGIRDLPAGLFDAGFASLATFLTGLAAVNLLGGVDLGVYAVFFAAYFAATVVPQTLVYTPSESIDVGRPLDERLDDVISSLKVGIAPTLAASVVILVAAVSVAGDTNREVTTALAVTAVTALFVSPAQDHVRRLLHIARRSWSAASLSGVQLVMVAVSLAAMIALEVPAAWIPFGALTVANTTTLGLGLLVTRSGHQNVPGDGMSFKNLARSGRWLLATAFVPKATLFVGSVVIVRLAGPEAMGFTEAARVAAQPILVVAAGLSAVLGPRGMSAAISRNLAQARHHHRIYVSLIVGTGIAYLAVAGHAWAGNPMMRLIPAAYVVEGLVAVTIVANIILGSMRQYRNELMGGRKEVQLARISLLTSPLLLLGAASAAVTGAFAQPIGLIMEGSVRNGNYHSARKRMYAETEQHSEAGSTAP